MARALNLLPSTSKTAPIIVRLSGHAQINDRLAIREMGRQIAEAEGKAISEEKDEEDGDGEEQEVRIILALLNCRVFLHVSGWS